MGNDGVEREEDAGSKRRREVGEIGENHATIFNISQSK